MVMDSIAREPKATAAVRKMKRKKDSDGRGADIVALGALQQDLVKDNGHTYFVNYLALREERPARSCAQACFVLAIICDSHPRGCPLCHQANLLKVLLQPPFLYTF